MTTILVVENNLLVSKIISDAFRTEMQAEIHCARTKSWAEQMIADIPFDFAFVSVMRNYSGFAVAETAVQENIPVLLTTGNPNALARLQEFGYPCLAKPYKVAALLCRATQIMRGASENVRRVKASVSKMTGGINAMYWLDRLIGYTADITSAAVFSNPDRKPIDIYVGGQLRRKRMESGLTQQHLASLIQVPTTCIIAYELGEVRIKPIHLIQFSSLLDIPLHFFFPTTDQRLAG